MMMNKICQIAAIGAVVCIATLAACRVVDWETFTSEDGKMRRLIGFKIPFAKSSNQRSLQQTDTRVCDVSLDASIAYNIQARHSGKVLTVQNGATSNGASIVQTTLEVADDLSQQWEIGSFFTTGNNPGDGRYWYVLNLQSGLALNVAGDSTKNGADIIQWPAGATNAETNAHWCFEPVEGELDYYTIIARHSNKAIDINGGSTADGANANQFTVKSTGKENQQFRIVPVGTITPTPPTCDSACASQPEYQDLLNAVNVLTSQAAALQGRISQLEAASPSNTPSYRPSLSPTTVDIFPAFSPSSNTPDIFPAYFTDTPTVPPNAYPVFSPATLHTSPAYFAFNGSPAMPAYSEFKARCVIKDIEGPDSILVGSGHDYTARGFPYGGTYSWSLSPTSIGGAGLGGRLNGPTVSVTGLISSADAGGDSELVITYENLDGKICTNSKIIEIVNDMTSGPSDTPTDLPTKSPVPSGSPMPSSDAGICSVYFTGPDRISLQSGLDSAGYTAQGNPGNAPGGTYSWEKYGGGASFYSSQLGPTTEVGAFVSSQAAGGPSLLVLTYTTLDGRTCTFSKFIETGDCSFVSEIEGPSFLVSSQEPGGEQAYTFQALVAGGRYSWVTGDGGAIVFFTEGETAVVGVVSNFDDGFQRTDELFVKYKLLSGQTCSSSKMIQIFNTDCYFASDIQGADSIRSRQNYTVEGLPSGGTYEWSVTSGGGGGIGGNNDEQTVEVEAYVSNEIAGGPTELVITYIVNGTACSISRLIDIIS